MIELLTKIAREVIEAYDVDDYRRIATANNLRYLGTGLYRTVFEIDGVAAKFVRDPHFKDQQYDEVEAYHWASGQVSTDPKRFEGWGLPAMSITFTLDDLPVVLSELIEGIGVYGSGNPWGIFDAHDQNCRLAPDGTIYILDIGFGVPQ